MARDRAAKAKGRTSINPLQPLKTEAEALSAARTGALTSGYLALSYSLQAAMLYFSGADLFGNTGLGILIGDAIAIAFALLLTWRILRRQALWATVVSALWYFAELAAKFTGTGAASHSGGMPSFNVGFLVMFFALGSAAIMGIRGAWKLRKGTAVAEVFE